MHWSENKKYKKKKICVPRQCDTDYGCPYPFQCDNKKGKCFLNKQRNKLEKCTEDKGKMLNFQISIEIKNYKIEY